jgi:SAM-dependent methyltransferase
MYKVETYWNSEMFRERVKGPDNLTGYPPAAPIHEMKTYEKLLLKSLSTVDSQDPSILVMGMTVAVRQVAHTLSKRVTCIDISRGAIEVLTSAIPSEKNERVILGNWFDLPDVLNAPRPEAIVGDGIFCTMQSVTDSRKLLQRLRSTVRDDGVVVLRVMLYPEEFKKTPLTPQKILSDFRSAVFDAEEFRFAMRLWGYTDKSYDDKDKMLDCGIAFEECRKMVEANLMTESEYSEMKKTFYVGKNFVPTQIEWEKLVEEEGFSHEASFLEGKHWFKYFPLYILKKVK